VTKTMDFFGHQELARRKTKLLVFYYVLAVLTLILLIYMAASLLLLAAAGDEGMTWDPRVLGLVTVAVLAVVGIGTFYKTSQLRSGGAKVARMLGGRRVSSSTDDPAERRLLNVVEEMAIASGVPMPEVYILVKEDGLNAFAAGWSAKDAAVAVTQGLLDNLNRDELQGVIAHEFSHVFHGDMRLNIRLMGVLFGIVCIATIGEIILRSNSRSSRSSRDKGGGQVAIFGLALMLIGWIGVIFSNLIKAAISRQREYLADAAAVTYTRNPRGIAMALARIGGLDSKLENAHAREASHMMFALGVGNWFGGLTSTHPPIVERVKRILPGFRPAARQGSAMVEAVRQTPLPQVQGFAASGGAGVAADGLTDRVGRLDDTSLAAARSLLQSLPLDVATAAHEPDRAGNLLLALVAVDTGNRSKAKGLDALPAARQHDTSVLAGAVQDLDPAARLPLLEITLGTLRQTDPAQQRELLKQAEQLAHADGRISPFELALLKISSQQLGSNAQQPGRRERTRPLTMLHDAASAVLSAIANAGSDDPQEQDRAFAAGAKIAELRTTQRLGADDARLSRLSAAVDQLMHTSPLSKRLLIAACGRTAAADGMIAAREGELLRALAACWGCPLPPLWANTQDNAAQSARAPD
jgi:Zn-dependent protease with chaperone function